jgi:hypothetical protein
VKLPSDHEELEELQYTDVEENYLLSGKKREGEENE